KQLAALEAENFDALPARAYARSFLRSYALALGLDPDPFLGEFDERVPAPESQPPTRLPRRRRELSPRIVLTLAAAAAALAFVAWSNVSTRQATAPPTPAPTPPAAEPT